MILLPLPKKTKTTVFSGEPEKCLIGSLEYFREKKGIFDTLLEVLYLFVMMRQLPLELQDDLLCVLALPNVCACM
jgi:hypothetical protein